MRSRARFIAAAIAFPITPLLFWLGGFNFNERGLPLAACAAITAILTVGVYGIACDITRNTPNL